MGSGLDLRTEYLLCIKCLLNTWSYLARKELGPSSSGTLTGPIVYKVGFRIVLSNSVWGHEKSTFLMETRGRHGSA